jgi:hypothetical protein
VVTISCLVNCCSRDACSVLCVEIGTRLANCYLAVGDYTTGTVFTQLLAGNGRLLRFRYFVFQATRHNTYGGVEVCFHLFLTSTLDGGDGQLQSSPALSLDIYWTRDWVGLSIPVLVTEISSFHLIVTRRREHIQLPK